MRDRPISAQTASIPIPNSSRHSHISLATQTGLRIIRIIYLRTCYNEPSVNRPQFGCQSQGCDFRSDSVVTLRKHQKVQREPCFTSLIINIRIRIITMIIRIITMIIINRCTGSRASPASSAASPLGTSTPWSSTRPSTLTSASSNAQSAIGGAFSVDKDIR